MKITWFKIEFNQLTKDFNHECKNKFEFLLVIFSLNIKKSNKLDW